MLHHFDCLWDEFERQVSEASGGILRPEVRLNSGIDFPETSLENRLRVSVFFNRDRE